MKKKKEEKKDKAKAKSQEKVSVAVQQRKPSQKSAYYKIFRKKMIDADLTISKLADITGKSRETITRWMSRPTETQFINTVLLMKTLRFTEEEAKEMVRMIIDELEEC